MGQKNGPDYSVTPKLGFCFKAVQNPGQKDLAFNVTRSSRFTVA